MNSTLTAASLAFGIAIIVTIADAQSAELKYGRNLQKPSACSTDFRKPTIIKMVGALTPAKASLQFRADKNARAIKVFGYTYQGRSGYRAISLTDGVLEICYYQSTNGTI